MQQQTLPRGRADVRDALIRAATQLFAQRGPMGVGVREIAQLAQVNHGLVHRHFGSKDGLVKAVQNRLADNIAESVGTECHDEDLPQLMEAVRSATSREGTWLRILAWSILSGTEEDDQQDRFPLARRMVRAAGRGPQDSLTPEARVTLVMSVGLGLMLFGPFLRRATGQSDSDWKRTGKQIAAVLSRPHFLS